MMDYSLATAAFTKGLSFLKTLGFDGPSVDMESSDLEGDVLLLDFSSDKAERAVHVSYVAAQKGRSSSMAVLIEGEHDNRFGLDDWLSKHGKSGKVSFSTWQTPNLDEETFIKEFCEAFEDLASHELKDILMGKAWEDVPMDWKGYR